MIDDSGQVLNVTRPRRVPATMAGPRHESSRRRWIGDEFDRRAATYDDSRMHHWQAERLVSMLPAMSGRTVLDVATGTGLVARLLAPTATVIGIDLSYRMLARAAVADVSGRGTWVQADAARLPLQDGCCDAILCVSALTYFDDMGAVLREWRRCARPDAVLALTSVAVDGAPELRILRAAARQHGFELPDPHAATGTPHALSEVLKAVHVEVHTMMEDQFHLDTTDSADVAFDRVLQYGGADAVLTRPMDEEQALRQTYALLSRAAVTSRHFDHRVLFALGRFRS